MGVCVCERESLGLVCKVERERRHATKSVISHLEARIFPFLIISLPLITLFLLEIFVIVLCTAPKEQLLGRRALYITQMARDTMGNN